MNILLNIYMLCQVILFPITLIIGHSAELWCPDELLFSDKLLEIKQMLIIAFMHQVLVAQTKNKINTAGVILLEVIVTFFTIWWNLFILVILLLIKGFALIGKLYCYIFRKREED